MKYIRTKNGRIYMVYDTPVAHGILKGDVEEIIITEKMAHEYNCNATSLKRVKEGDRGYYVPKSQILNQADTIEELCDEFCSNFNGVYPTFIGSLEEVLEHNKKSIQPNQIKGAIWTDKGLIYVAKLNEKGELELL